MMMSTDTMTKVQYAIWICAREESGIWEVLNEVAAAAGVGRAEALALIQAELDFINLSSDIYLVRSTRLYDTSSCEVIAKEELARLSLKDVEFVEKGPFYYFSSVPSI